MKNWYFDKRVNLIGNQLYHLPLVALLVAYRLGCFLFVRGIPFASIKFSFGVYGIKFMQLAMGDRCTGGWRHHNVYF